MNDSRAYLSRFLTFWALALAAGGALLAHPMGNFSINHYALIMPGAQTVEVLYVLDLAELPTFQLLQKWDLKKDSPRAALEAKAHAEAEEWVRNLTFSENGTPVKARLERTDIAIQDGAGGLPVLRVNSHLKILGKDADGKPVTFEYEDKNFVERAGWKEVVIEARAGATVAHPVPEGQDRTRALTAYPQDPTVAPPQDTLARFDWTMASPVVSEVVTPEQKPVASPAPPPVTAATPVPSSPAVVTGAAPAEADSLGTVKRGDFLSRTLKGSKGPLSFGLALILLAAAFGVGALHAVEPGHGKTMVAAYLVGSKGTFRQAIFLGGMVTFTHTISVFALGLVTLFLSQYVLPDTLIRFTGVVSGVSIIWIGGLLLYRRTRKLMTATAHERGHSHEHHEHEHHEHEPHTHEHHEHEHAHAHAHAHAEVAAHAHSHAHPHEHPHVHPHEHPHSHAEAHAHHHHDHGHNHALTHTHDGHTHSHVPEGEVTMGNLIALGISGGLVPCPAALVLLLSCISIGRPGLGLLLLISFSIGLALVLMLIGVMVLFVKNSVPKSRKPSHLQAWARFAPVVSAALIFAIGIYMTGVAVGAFPVVRLIG